MLKIESIRRQLREHRYEVDPVAVAASIVERPSVLAALLGQAGRGRPVLGDVLEAVYVEGPAAEQHPRSA